MRVIIAAGAIIVALAGSARSQDWAAKADKPIRAPWNYVGGSWGQGRTDIMAFTVKGDPDHVIVVPPKKTQYFFFQDPTQLKEFKESRRVFDTLEKNGIPVVPWTQGTYKGQIAVMIPKDTNTLRGGPGDGFWNLNETSLEDAQRIAELYRKSKLPYVMRGYSIDPDGHVRISEAWDMTRHDDGTPKDMEGLPLPRLEETTSLLMGDGVHFVDGGSIEALVKKAQLAKELVREGIAVNRAEKLANALVAYAPASLDIRTIHQKNYDAVSDLPLVQGDGNDGKTNRLERLLERAWGLSPEDARKTVEKANARSYFSDDDRVLAQKIKPMEKPSDTGGLLETLGKLTGKKDR